MAKVVPIKSPTKGWTREDMRRIIADLAVQDVLRQLCGQDLIDWTNQTLDGVRG